MGMVGGIRVTYTVYTVYSGCKHETKLSTLSAIRPTPSQVCGGLKKTEIRATNKG